MSNLFDKHGGFRRLHSFTLATIVQLDTLRFCRQFLTQDHRQASEKFYDPKGRQYNMLKAQIEAQGKAFEASGGFSERLMTRRLEAREQQKAADAPACPHCNRPMRRRTSAKGDFWGCPAYPECKGTRPA